MSIKNIRAAFLVTAAVLSLSGCSYFDAGEEAGSASPAERIDITAPGMAGPPPLIHVDRDDTIVTEGPVDMTAGVGAVERRSMPPPQDLMSVARSVSSGSVEIYPLDGAVSPSNSSDSIEIRDVRTVPVSRGYFSDPSVEVFPLDDAMGDNLPVHLRAGGQGAGLAPMPGEMSNFNQPPADAGGGFISVNSPGGNPMRIYFAHNSTNADDQALDVVANLVKQGAGRSISIEGHASSRADIQDPQQRKYINLKVSADRALSVARRLIEKGVPADLIHIEGWGETRPAGPADGKDAEAASRRVEIR